MKLSENMRGMLRVMLSHKRGDTTLILDERTALALTRRKLLRLEPEGFVLNRRAAIKALEIAK